MDDPFSSAVAPSSSPSPALPAHAPIAQATTRPKRMSEGNTLHRLASENLARSNLQQQQQQQQQQQIGSAFQPTANTALGPMLNGPRGRSASNTSASIAPSAQPSFFSSLQPFNGGKYSSSPTSKKASVVGSQNMRYNQNYQNHQNRNPQNHQDHHHHHHQSHDQHRGSTFTNTDGVQNIGGSIFTFAGLRTETLPVSAQGPDEVLDEEELSAVDLRFRDLTLEHTYEEYFWEKFHLELRALWGWTIVLFIIYTGVLVALQTDKVSITIVIHGIFVLTPMTVIYKFGNNHYMSHQWCMTAHSLAIISSTIGAVLVISIIYLGSVEKPASLGGLIMILSCLVPNMRISFVHTAIINVVVFAAFVGAMGFSDNGFSDPLETTLQLCILFIVCLLNTRVARLWERHFRFEFMYSRRIGGENERLRLQVWKLERNSLLEPDVLDMESPIEKAVSILKDVMSRVGETEAQCLDQVLKVITQHQDMLRPNFTAQFEQGKTIDGDVENWLFYELASREKKPLSRQNSSGSRRSITASVRRLSALSIIPTVTPEEEILLEQMLAQQIPWNWNVFEINEITHGRPLYFVVMYLFKKYDFFTRFKVDEHKLQNFIGAVEDGYNKKVPYHNNIHAADVVLSLHHLFSVGKLSKHVSELELMAGILAAAVHDYGHPGYNNAFQINSMSKKALIYNDKSVLENFHISATWMLMKEPRNDFSFMFSDKEKKDLRTLMIDMVLATDMAHHFETLSDMKTRIAAGDFNFEDARNKALLMKVALKVADVGHVAKREDLHDKWTNLIQSEFYLQGDKEKSNGLPVSPFMDRENSSIPKSQIGFINFVVLPLFEAFNFTGDHTTLVQQIKKNQVLWEARLKLEPLSPRAQLGQTTLPSISMAPQILPPIPSRQASHSEMETESPVEKEFASEIMKGDSLYDEDNVNTGLATKIGAAPSLSVVVTPVRLKDIDAAN